MVLKTAAIDIPHKTEQDGVVLNIKNLLELTAAYEEMSLRLGSRVLVSSMVTQGTEVGLGVINDENFGPFLMISAGGIFIEIMNDRAVSLMPVTPKEADDLLSSLKINKLIQGIRGRSIQDRAGLIKIIMALSQLALELQDYISEIDINPVIVNDSQSVAVDGLVLLK